MFVVRVQHNINIFSRRGPSNRVTKAENGVLPDVATIRYSNTMGCPPVRGDNPRALASGLSYVQVDKHGITVLYHLYQC